MSENNTGSSNDKTKVPFDIMWVAVLIMGLLTGLRIGTVHWIQEPIRHAGFAATLIVSISLVVAGIVVMGNTFFHRHEGYRFSMYIMLYGGITLVNVGGSILLGAPAPFGF